MFASCILFILEGNPARAAPKEFSVSESWGPVLRAGLPPTLSCRYLGSFIPFIFCFIKSALFIYFWPCCAFVAVRGLPLVPPSRGYSSWDVRLLIAMVSLVVERWLQACWLQ